VAAQKGFYSSYPLNHYYRQRHAPEGVDPNIFEKWLGSALEPNTKNAFEKLLARLQDVTEEE
jgi:hypothetical protein